MLYSVDQKRKLKGESTVPTLYSNTSYHDGFTGCVSNERGRNAIQKGRGKTKRRDATWKKMACALNIRDVMHELNNMIVQSRVNTNVFHCQRGKWKV